MTATKSLSPRQVEKHEGHLPRTAAWFALGKIDAGAEELHLLAEPHGRNAAGDAVVIAPEGAHQVVVLVLE